MKIIILALVLISFQNLFALELGVIYKGKAKSTLLTEDVLHRELNIFAFTRTLINSNNQKLFTFILNVDELPHKRSSSEYGLIPTQISNGMIMGRIIKMSDGLDFLKQPISYIEQPTTNNVSTIMIFFQGGGSATLSANVIRR